MKRKSWFLLAAALSATAILSSCDPFGMGGASGASVVTLRVQAPDVPRSALPAGAKVIDPNATSVEVIVQGADFGTMSATANFIDRTATVVLRGVPCGSGRTFTINVYAGATIVNTRTVSRDLLSTTVNLDMGLVPDAGTLTSASGSLIRNVQGIPGSSRYVDFKVGAAGDYLLTYGKASGTDLAYVYVYDGEGLKLGTIEIAKGKRSIDLPGLRAGATVYLNAWDGNGSYTFTLSKAAAGTLAADFGVNGQFLAMVPKPDTDSWETLVDSVADSQGRIVSVYQYAVEAGTDIVVTRRLGNGTPDTTFNGCGRRNVNVDYTDAPKRVFVDKNDDVFVIGETIALDTSRRFFAVKLAKDGSFATFGMNGSVVVQRSTFNAYCRGGTLLDDGGVLLCGYDSDGQSNNAIILKIKPDGSVDTGFGAVGWCVVGSSANATESMEISDVSVASLGSYIWYVHYSGASSVSYVGRRVLIDGQAKSFDSYPYYPEIALPDMTVGPKARANRCLAISDDEMWCAGDVQGTTTPNPQPVFIRRYTGTNGCDSFSGGSIQDSVPLSVASLIRSSDGFYLGCTVPARNMVGIAKFTLSGAPDTNFNARGLQILQTGAVDNAVSRAIILSGGEGMVAISVTDSSSQQDGLFWKFKLSDGTLASSAFYRESPVGTQLNVRATAVLDDGNVLVAGSIFLSGFERPFLGAFTPQGELKWQKVDIKVAANGRFTDVEIGADGIINAAGYFNFYGIECARVTQDGSFSSTIGSWSDFVQIQHQTINSVNALTLGPDRIYIAGAVNSGNSFTNYLLSLNLADGSVAASSTIAMSSITNAIRDIEYHPAGYLVCVGSEYSSTDSQNSFILTVEPLNLTEISIGDASAANAIFMDIAQSVAIAADGSVLVGGYLRDTVDSKIDPYAMKYMLDSITGALALDTSWAASGFFRLSTPDIGDTLTTIAALPGGRVAYAGSRETDSSGATSRAYVQVLGANGSAAEGWTVTGSSGNLTTGAAISVASDGSILLAGTSDEGVGVYNLYSMRLR